MPHKQPAPSYLGQLSAGGVAGSPHRRRQAQSLRQVDILSDYRKLVLASSGFRLYEIYTGMTSGRPELQEQHMAIYTVSDDLYVLSGWAMRRSPATQPETHEDSLWHIPSSGMAVNPAEHRTLREDCGLSLRECAAWHRVSERTINLWEAPSRGGPPSKAAAHLTALRAHLAVEARNAVDQALAAALPGQPVEIGRYTSADYASTQYALLGLPHGAHNRMVSLAADILVAMGRYPVICYHGISSKGPTPDVTAIEQLDD